MNTTADLHEVKITTIFDRRVDKGVIVYNKDFRAVFYSDKGFDFEFRLLSGLDKKPNPSSPPVSSGCRPGSDIDVSGFEISALGPTHLLAFNKFSSARPHLLVLTQDGFTRQYEPLNIDDFTALRSVLMPFFENSKRRYLAIFNCGVDSGCSRLHKHMQVFPAGGDTSMDDKKVDKDFPLWPDSEDPAVENNLPFQCFVHHFSGDEFPSAEKLTEIYQRLVGEAECALTAFGHHPQRQEVENSNESSSKEGVPHNVILDRRWMVVVPRRSAGTNGADANAAAYLGMVWLSDEDKMRLWTDQGPASVLRQLGFPRSSQV
ncbi:hypothetical protein QBC35DRAFT_501344 [Podospora australis]|uniref:Uncharacterized protein n=1 Tax=Podospora australis TaxID=1536484 RepID=A0AAN6WR25_9PEZI|nr:hypothetical protein QBC35DRAFT_501344 [Podospora australis]